LPLSSCAASCQGAGTALRRCDAPTRPDQRAILVNDVPEPPETTRYGGSCVPTRNGPDHSDGRSQGVAAPRSGQGRSRPCGRSRPSDDPDGKGAKVARTRRSSLEEYPQRSRGTSARWRFRPPPEQFTYTLLIIPRGRESSRVFRCSASPKSAGEFLKDMKQRFRPES
jgi:hypothetical protein